MLCTLFSLKPKGHSWQVKPKPIFSDYLLGSLEYKKGETLILSLGAEKTSTQQKISQYYSSPNHDTTVSPSLFHRFSYILQLFSGAAPLSPTIVQAPTTPGSPLQLLVSRGTPRGYAVPSYLTMLTIFLFFILHRSSLVISP
jgi:hypothetical protein